MPQPELAPQKAVLAAVDTGIFDSESSLEELRELADTAGAEVLGVFSQKRDRFDNATYLGEGKLREIADFCAQYHCELLIADDELSGSQIRNMEKILDVKVIDRTMLILDIFAQRAMSSEGKLQVELAQQKYLLPRLAGVGTSMSRLGGGIGTRGPGETKLESDRRHIRRRIEALERQLDTLEKRRLLIRERRKKNSVPTIAIVGYTNVGKSTLLNLLTESEVYVQNQLFATLDPTAREIVLPDGQHAIIIDTVGLIQRLPHHLVEAFRSTLEEAASADLILMVCDCANPAYQDQLSVTRDLLASLGCAETPAITVFNKTDLAPAPLFTLENAAAISAKNCDGVEELLHLIAAKLSASMRRLRLLLPYSEGTLLGRIRQNGKVLSEEYRENGIEVEALVEIKQLKAVLPYLLNESESASGRKI